MTWSGSPTLDRPSAQTPLGRIPPLKYEEEDDDTGSEEGQGDDFDDFEEGAEVGADDDFGDFDDGFEESSASEAVAEPQPLLQDEHQSTFVSRQSSNSSHTNLFHRIPLPKPTLIIQ